MGKGELAIVQSMMGKVPGDQDLEAVAFALVFTVAFAFAGGVAFAVAFAFAVDVTFAVAIGVAVGLVFVIVLDVMGSVAVGLVLAVAGGVGATINSWLPIISFPFLIVWNYLLYGLDKTRNAKSPCLFRWHSAFWDEWQRLRLFGLDEHLLFVIKHNPVEGKAALEYLATSPQRWAVQAVQIELDAGNLQACTSVQAIRQIHRSLEIGELQSPINHILRIFKRVSEDVDAALNQKDISKIVYFVVGEHHEKFFDTKI
ncbi:hypothetical protein NSMS1_35700 [Nostoc sp. MS1]|nr:hypothetical protein NSMS1_35700 [Nostoc sp. MS1]